MDQVLFPGHQEGERVLYKTKPHIGIKYLTIAAILIFGFFLLLAVQFTMAAIFPDASFQIIAFIFLAIAIAAVLWWINLIYTKTTYFITDRRIVKFHPTTPVFIATRSLFWDQAMKSKTYHRNPVVQKIFGVGSVNVHPRYGETDNLDIHDVIYHNDLGNYIDKLIFLANNKPEEIPAVREFVPKPVGERY